MDRHVYRRVSHYACQHMHRQVYRRVYRYAYKLVHGHMYGQVYEHVVRLLRACGLDDADLLLTAAEEPRLIATLQTPLGRIELG